MGFLTEAFVLAKQGAPFVLKDVEVGTPVLYDVTTEVLTNTSRSTVQLDDPKPSELLVKITACGRKPWAAALVMC